MKTLVHPSLDQLKVVADCPDIFLFLFFLENEKLRSLVLLHLIHQPHHLGEKTKVGYPVLLVESQWPPTESFFDVPTMMVGAQDILIYVPPGTSWSRGTFILLSSLYNVEVVDVVAGDDVRVAVPEEDCLLSQQVSFYFSKDLHGSFIDKRRVEIKKGRRKPSKIYCIVLSE